MRRIKAACLEQTIHFQTTDAQYHKRESIERETRQEFEAYKAGLERKKTKFKVVNELPQNDGTLVVKIKKQYNSHNCGEYLD